MSKLQSIIQSDCSRRERSTTYKFLVITHLLALCSTVGSASSSSIASPEQARDDKVVQTVSTEKPTWWNKVKSFYRSPASEARKIIVREIECAVEEKDIIVREIECAVEEKAIARMIGLIKGMAQIAQLPIETEAKGVLLGVNQECRRDLVVLEHHQRARLTLLGRNLKLIVARLPVHT